MLRLRQYQRDAVDSVPEYFEHNTGNPIIVMPTGSGKSLVQAYFQKEVLERWPGQRFLLLTHVKELVEQNADKLRAIWPHAPLGLYSASLGRRDASRAITMATIQSIWKMAALVGHVDMVIVDECHLIPSKSETMYRSFLNDLQAINPKVKVLGMSATPYRMDSGWLHKGKDSIFTDICFDLPVKRLIDEGWLAPLVSKGAAQQIDLSKVRTRAGEFATDDVEAALHVEGVLESAINEIIEHGRNRRAWLIFCQSVASSTEVADILSVRGYPTASLDGTTNKEDRTRVIEQFRAGRLHLTNVNVLTTGFDAPICDMMAILRATKSTGLYVQILGRGMRLCDGKDDCLVLDFGGNVKRHGPVDDLVINWSATGEANPAKSGDIQGAKECPKCQTFATVFARKCVNPLCDHEWPYKPAAPTHEGVASNLPIISGLNEPVWLNVNATTFGVAAKKDRPPSVRIDYVCGARVISEWVCVEHEGYAQQQARDWYLSRGLPMPATAGDAVRSMASVPAVESLQVRREGKYDRIVGFKLKAST